MLLIRARHVEDLSSKHFWFKISFIYLLIYLFIGEFLPGFYFPTELQ